MTVRPLLAAAALAAAASLLTGCMSGGYAASPAAESRYMASQAGGLAGSIDEIGVSDRTAGVFFNSTTPSALAAMDPAAFAASRMVARNATLAVELPVVNDEKGKPDRKATDKAIEQAAKTAAAIGKELKGWVVYESQHRVVLRVPAESLDTALEQIGALGEVTDQTVTGSDVTDQHRDNAIRLDNLEKSRQRYLKLLASAEDVKAALAVEKELERVTLEIERLKGQQKSLETSVRFSLVTVSFSGAYPKKSGPMPGPLGWVFYGLWWFVKWLFIWE
ncbi:MAG: DUF4349 domain-containing protein [Planctomycetota bacterium]|jgi:nucleotide-binding universal stress UspA family protein